MPQPPSDPTPRPTIPHQFRSGTAARLAGLPVTTLRVWERRYGVISAAKTEGGQRMYSAHDVERLRLMRQLTHAGHAIGTIANLALEALQALAAGLAGGGSPGPVNAGSAPVEAFVIGRSIAHALETVPACVLRGVFDDLDQAEAALRLAPSQSPVLLLVRVASLQPEAVARVRLLGAGLRAAAILVTYAFGTEASARALREAGVTVHREPASARELVRWVRSMQERCGPSSPAAWPPSPAPASLPESPAGPWPVAPRCFSDKALAQLAAMPSPVACECLRHMAEIVSQLASFERYSQECSATGPADAALHQHLSHTAGSARTLFEQALQQVITQEGLQLPPAPARLGQR